MIFFIGDKPSKKNKDPRVAFVGTPSYKTLLSWIAQMDVDIHEVILANKDDIRAMEVDAWFTAPRAGLIGPHHKVVALGDAASKHLDSIGLKHFKLPHPSGLNRKLNDKKYVDQVLGECYRYLNNKGA